MLQTARADTKTADARGNSTQAPPAQDGLLAPPVPAGLAPEKELHPRAEMQPSRAGHSGTEQLCSPIAALQKSIGNQAVLRMLNRSAPAIQARLAVNQPGDAFEQEADRVADQVMRLTVPPGVLRKTDSQEQDNVLSRKCAGCEQEEKNTALQRKEKGGGPRFATRLVQEVLSAPGQPLDAATRAYMEPRFGHDFSRVRVHTGPTAAESARSISALAFTSAHNIVFGSGQYSPGSNQGRKLLAHELTHVLQQETGASSIQREDSPVDAAAVANEVEQLVRPGNDEKGALDKLKALDMAVLLKVVGQIYDDADVRNTDEGKRDTFKILSGDLAPSSGGAAGPGQSLSEAERVRLRSAFDAAPTRKLRNPKEGDPSGMPTLSGARNMSAATGPARPGDWGEDPGGNTWVAHTEGIRSYFASKVPSDMRTSTWLGNNPSNFDYEPSLTPRAISSFHWGTGAHHFAIYLNVGDASADLRARVRQFQTIGNYIRAHLGKNVKDKNKTPEDYIKFMQRAVAVNANDPTAAWAGDDKTFDSQKWDSLVEGFKAAEGWRPVPTITAANVKTLSSDPKDAPLIAYYQRLLGSTP